ncbi:MAG: hypothetical protein KKI08_10200 [Armatimonadetes bacterium]|nr:hypothetical protein [Armatimonadota bacterium]
MLGLSRLLLIVAALTGICAVIARFVQPSMLLMILPATWLEVTGVLLLFSIATAILGIAERVEKRAP